MFSVVVYFYPFVNIIYNFVRIVNVNSFFYVLGYSLPDCGLLLHAEYKYTMV